jgi:molybdopterin converting factor subunit 1
MRVTVRLFARLREIAGAGELTVDVSERATIADVWREVARQHAALNPYAHVVSAARNLEYARPDTPVADGDEIAFLPPVSGGTLASTGDYQSGSQMEAPRPVNRKRRKWACWTS